MIPLVDIFCSIDDFCKYFEESGGKNLIENPERKREKPCRMSLSEIMTIEVMFHFSHYRTFKDFYVNNVLKNYREEFPQAVSYTRFLELKGSAFMPLIIFLLMLKGEETGIYFADSTKLFVCDNLRIRRNKVFKNIAKRGKTSTGWFFGFKLHLVFNNKGEFMRFALTPGNVDDRAPIVSMMKKLKGLLFADRGYISEKLKKILASQELELVTKVRRNMKPKPLSPLKNYLLSKRNMVETIIDQLKNMLHIQHTRHRSVMNFQINVLGGLLAYIFKPRKVSVPFHFFNHNPSLLTPS